MKLRHGEFDVDTGLSKPLSERLNPDKTAASPVNIQRDCSHETKR